MMEASLLVVACAALACLVAVAAIVTVLLVSRRNQSR